MKKRFYWGLLFTIISSVVYGIEPTVLSFALRQGVTAAEATMGYNISALCCSVVGCIICRKTFRIDKNVSCVLIALGALGSSVVGVLLAESYNYIPVGCATVLHFLYPTVVCITMWLFFGGKMGILSMLAIVLSTMGLWLISGDTNGASIRGVVLAALSGIAYAAYILGLNKSVASSVDELVKAFYISLGGAAASTIFVLLCDRSGVRAYSNIGVLAITGILVYIGGIMFIMGVDRCGATVTSFFSLLEPTVSIIVSTLVYHYLLSKELIWGSILLLLALLLITISDLKANSKGQKEHST